jgi:serine/threonine-protein kinase
MAQGRTIGRYVLWDEIGTGGMATVHLGRLLGEGGFSRTVAIKRLHPQCARDPQFVTLFLDEAHVTSRIRHPNVVSMLDVVQADDELLLVMEYIHGEPLSRLMTLTRDASSHVAPRVAVAVIVDVLRGLHAAHEATTEMGEPLGIIHRDVTPQNILVGADGATRLVDFGIAKAASRMHVTGEGQIKGKFPYMAPEQIQDKAADRRLDVYAASVVLWEMLAAQRLFVADNPANVITRVLEMEVEPPSSVVPSVPRALDAVVMKGLSRDPRERYPTAEAMAHALEEATAPATAREVQQWVRSIASEPLATRAKLVATIESATQSTITSSTPSLPVSRPPLEPSQISNISVSVTARKPGPARTLASVAAVVAMVGAAFVLAFVLARRSVTASPPSLGVATPSASAPTPHFDLPPETAIIEMGTGTQVRPPPAAHAPRPTPSASAPKPNCNPPYTVDPTDPRVHIPKRECI